MKEKLTLKKKIFALLGALLFALCLPHAKTLLDRTSTFYFVTFLYLGAGAGSFILKFSNVKSIKIQRNVDIPYVITSVIAFVLGSICFFSGIDGACIQPEFISLICLFQIAAAMFFSVLINTKKFSADTFIGSICIAVGVIPLSIARFGTLKFTNGHLSVLFGLLLFGFSSTLSTKINAKNVWIANVIKCLSASAVSLILGIIRKESPQDVRYFLIAAILGFITIGLGKVFYENARINSSFRKVNGFYVFAPIISAVLSFAVYKNTLGMTFFVGLALMMIGAAFITENNNLFLPIYAVSILLITVIRPWHGSFDFLYGSINFNFVTDYIKLYGTSKYIFYYLLLGNIGCFVPLGFYLKYFKKTKFYVTVLIGLGFSLIIETLQFFFGSGVSELNDLILNTSGTVIGYLLGLLFSRP